MNNKSITRRQLMRHTARAAGAGMLFTVIPRHVLGGPGYTPPSEQLSKAVIGVGGMGKWHLGDDGTRLIAVCDVDAHHLQEALDIGGRGVRGYRDFRDVLARPDLDIVHIATPPHWHALISIAAAEAGKDIFCEKPMTRTIGEGRKVIEAVRRNGQIFRLNTWFRFADVFYGMETPVRPIKKLVKSRLLGWPLKVTVNGSTGFDWKFEWGGKTNLTPEQVPGWLDYSMWLGPAPYKPYHPHRVHQTFRGYWDYDGGGLGDMGQHYLDAIQYILGKDHTSPVEIEADSPQQHPDAVGPWRRVRMRYADSCEIVLDGENRDTHAAFIEGPKGRLYPGFESDIQDLQEKLATFPDPELQVTDFSYAVKSRKKFALNEENAHRSCTLINLAKIAVRLRRPLQFEPDEQRFVDDDEANRLIDQPMRSPWHM